MNLTEQIDIEEKPKETIKKVIEKPQIVQNQSTIFEKIKQHKSELIVGLIAICGLMLIK